MKITTTNSTFAIGGVSCSADTFVQAESSVLRTNFSAKMPALRVAAKRHQLPTKKKLQKMKRILFSIFLLTSLNSNAQNSAEKKMILGSWKYNIVSDGIAEADTTDFYKSFAEREKKMFFTKIKVNKSTAKLFENKERLNATWEIKNSNEIYFFIENSKILKYLIIKLTNETLELCEPNSKISTLVYYKQ